MTTHHKGPASARQGGLESYLKHHRHQFLALVSLLLLLSLFVREVIRDKAKEESEITDNARNMFYLRMDVLQASDRIMENIEPGNDAPLPAVPQDQLEAELKKQLKVDFAASIAAIHMGDTLSRLARVVKLTDAEQARLDSINKRNAERGKTFQAVSLSLEKRTATPEDLKTAKKIANDASALDWDILDFGTSLADRADEETDRQEARYRWAFYVSLLLAVSLWYLAFLGKRYDVDLPEIES